MSDPGTRLRLPHVPMWKQFRGVRMVLQKRDSHELKGEFKMKCIGWYIREVGTGDGRGYSTGLRCSPRAL